MRPRGKRIGLASLARLPVWAWYVLGALVWTAAVVATVTPAVLSERAVAITEAKAWTIEGPPCPSIDPATPRWPYRPDKAFGYAGANFAWAYGHVACAQIHDDGGRAMFSGHPVCQFTGPAVVAVDTGGRKTVFVPGMGRRATVSVQGGVARCVVAGDFYGQNDF